MNMYRRIDCTRVQFDYLVHHACWGVFEDEIEALGGHGYLEFMRKSTAP